MVRFGADQLPHGATLSDWTCACTAINPLLKKQCWRCSASRPESIADQALNSVPSLRDLLAPHVGETVSVNFRSPTALEPALLVGVSVDSFVLQATDSGAQHHLPLRWVLSVVDHGDEGLMIEVYRQVFVRGATTVGVSFPI